MSTLPELTGTETTAQLVAGFDAAEDALKKLITILTTVKEETTT